MDEFKIMFRCIIILDVVDVTLARDLLKDFLPKKKSKQATFKENYKNESIKNRITLDLIEPMLSKHVREYKRLHNVYIWELYSIVPELILMMFFYNHCSGRISDIFQLSVFVLKSVETTYIGSYIGKMKRW